MIFIKRFFLIVCIFFSIITQAQEKADIQYVTGKLRLSLYAQADSGSNVIKLLASGDQLEVLEIAGPYARVRTSQDKEGWVKRGFLVKNKPAIILYNEVNAAYKDLQQQMEEFKKNNKNKSELEEKINDLEQQNKKLQLSNDLLKKELKSVSTDQKEKGNNNIDLIIFKQFIKEYKFYLLGLLILLLLIGYRMGELKTENKVIKHFGGVRVW